jgi:hypothetical protein
MGVNEMLRLLFLSGLLCSFGVSLAQTVSGRYQFETLRVPKESDTLVLQLSVAELDRYLLSLRSESREDFAVTAGITAKQDRLDLKSPAAATFRSFRPLEDAEYDIARNSLQVRKTPDPNAVLVVDVALPVGRRISIQVNGKTLHDMAPAEGLFLDSGSRQPIRLPGVHALLAYLQANPSPHPGKLTGGSSPLGPTSVAPERLSELLTSYLALGNVPTETARHGYLTTLVLRISHTGDVLSVGALPSGFNYLRDAILQWKFRSTPNGLLSRVPILITPAGELVSPLSPSRGKL